MTTILTLAKHTKLQWSCSSLREVEASFKKTFIIVEFCGWTSFFFSNSSCRQISDHPQEYVTKFDNRPNMKIEKFKNIFIFWLLDATCL